MRVVRLLADLGSEACRIFGALRLNRERIKEVLKILKDERSAQATFGSIVCATRFKFFTAEAPGILLPTV